MATFPVVNISPRILPKATPVSGQGIVDAAELLYAKHQQDVARADRAEELRAARQHDVELEILRGGIQSRQIGERGDVEKGLIGERGRVEADVVIPAQHEARVGEIQESGAQARQTNKEGYELEAPQRDVENTQRWYGLETDRMGRFIDLNESIWRMNEQIQGRSPAGQRAAASGARFPLQNLAWNVGRESGLFDSGEPPTPDQIRGLMGIAAGDPNAPELLFAKPGGEDAGAPTSSPPSIFRRGAARAPDFFHGSWDAYKNWVGTGHSGGAVRPEVRPGTTPGSAAFPTPGGDVELDGQTLQSLRGLSPEDHVQFLQGSDLDPQTVEDYLAVLENLDPETAAAVRQQLGGR